MLRGAGEAHVERLAELADRFLAERKAGEHPAPGRVGQCPEGDVESIFNHVVENGEATRLCQPFS